MDDASGSTPAPLVEEDHSSSDESAAPTRKRQRRIALACNVSGLMPATVASALHADATTAMQVEEAEMQHGGPGAKRSVQVV